MASKTNMTSDHRHVQFGEDDPLNTTGLPVTPSGDAGFCPNWFGQIMVNPDGGGFGAAYIDQDDYD